MSLASESSGRFPPKGCNPDRQTCWICKRVKTRRTYRDQHDNAHHAYLCGHCDAPCGDV